MVLGILSVTLCCCSIIGLICAVLGLIFGIIAQKNNPNGKALAGIITSAFGIVFGIIGVATSGLIMSTFEEMLSEIGDIVDSSFEDSSSFNNNNNAIIGLFNLIKRVIGL